MPSAYVLAKDQIEQARAILANEVWYDAETDHLLELVLHKLRDLDIAMATPVLAERRIEPMPPDAPMRSKVLPWLDR